MEGPRAVSVSSNQSASSGAVAAAQLWYNLVIPATQRLPLDWDKAVALGEPAVVLTPVHEAQNLFKKSSYQGVRYVLITATDEQNKEATIAEVLAKGVRRNEQQMQNLVLNLYQKYKGKNAINQHDFRGFVFFYTVAYQFVQGEAYVGNGRAPHPARLQARRRTAPRRPANSTEPDGGMVALACTDYYDESGNYITTGGDCSTIPYDPDSGVDTPGGTGDWGGPTDPNGTGGNEGGGYSTPPQWEYIDPTFTFTPTATPPPDVTQYNCDQLRLFHKDDFQAAGVNLETFLNVNAGQSRSQVIAQRGYQQLAHGMVSLSMGPTLRYIRDPQNPDVFIDLRHMLVVAYYGPAAGNSVEVFQSEDGQASAFDHQDYYSNQLGYDFYNNYGSSVASEPGKFTELLEHFLTQPTSYRGVPNRSRNTDPALVNQRCP